MSDWVQTTLSEVARITIGKTPPRKDPRYWTSDLTRPFCTIADMNARSVEPIREGVTELAEATGKAKRFPAGSLMMSFKLSIGRVGFAARDLFPNEAIARFETDPSVLDERYLALWLEGQDLTAGAGRAVKGNTLNQASMRVLPVAYPDLSTQRRIIHVLGAVDELIRSLDEELRATSTLLIQAREELFARVWRSAPAVPLSQVIAEERRPVEIEGDVQYYQIGVRSHGRGVFTKQPVTGTDLGSKKVFWVEPGDLVVNIVFGWEGAVAVVPSQVTGYCASHRFPTFLRADDGPVEYVRHFLLSRRGVETLGLASPGGAGRNRTLNRKRLLAFTFPLPPAAEQERLARALSSIEEGHEALSREIAALRQVRTSLLSAILDQRMVVPDSYDAMLEETS